MNLEIFNHTDARGYSVRTLQAIKHNELITTFDGYRGLDYYQLNQGDEISNTYTLDEDVYVILTHQGHIFETGNECVYGYKADEVLKHNSGYGSLINDLNSVKTYDRESVDRYILSREDPLYNCIMKISSCGKIIEVIASRDIEEGEELLSYYGHMYWLKHLNDARFNDGYQYCKIANGKTFLEYVERKYRNFDLREGLNYTPNILE